MATYQSTHTGAQIDAAVDAVAEKLPLTGGTITGALTVSGNLSTGGDLFLTNGSEITSKDSGGTDRAIISLSSANNLAIGYDMVGVGDVNLYGNNVRFRVGGTAAANQAMLITSNKKIGIGTTTPSELLDVNGNIAVTGEVSSVNNVRHINGAYEYWKDSNGDDVGIHSLSSSNNFWVGYGLCPKGYQLRIGGGSIQFYYGTSRTAGMILTTAGNVGIGTTSPSAKLHIVGDVVITGGLSLAGNAVVSVLSGSTAPSSSTGSNGDIYIQTS